MNKNVKIVVSVISTVCIVGVSSLVYDWYKSEVNYENLLKQADNYLDKGDYDKAEQLYHQSKDTKETAHVDNKLDLLKNREQLEKTLKEAEELLNNNKVEDALDLLGNLPKIPNDFDKDLSDKSTKIETLTHDILNKQHDTTTKLSGDVDAFNNFSNKVEKVNNDISSKIGKLVDILKNHNI